MCTGYKCTGYSWMPWATRCTFSIDSIMVVCAHELPKNTHLITVDRCFAYSIAIMLCHTVLHNNVHCICSYYNWPDELRFEQVLCKNLFHVGTWYVCLCLCLCMYMYVQNIAWGRPCQLTIWPTECQYSNAVLARFDGIDSQYHCITVWTIYM